MEKASSISKSLIKPIMLVTFLGLLGMINVKAQTYEYDPPYRTYTDCGSGYVEKIGIDYYNCDLTYDWETFQLGQVHSALWSYNSGVIKIRVQKCSGYFRNGNSGKIIISTTEGILHCTNFYIYDDYTDYVTATWDYGELISKEIFQVYLITSDQVYKFDAGLITITPYYTISVSASPSSGGWVYGGGEYERLDYCTITAEPRSGYNFVRWKKNGSTVSTNPEYTFRVMSDASFVAEFEEDTYYISASASPSSGGSVSGDGYYGYGSTCTLYATPNTGYSFVRWTRNGSQVSTNPTYSFTVTGDASYVAVFSQNSYTISASASPSAGGTVNGAGSYNHGSNCTLTATANTGYTFVRWTRNGSQVSTNPTYSFTVTGNASYVAVFNQNSYTVSASASPSAGGTVNGAGSYNHGSNCTLTATANTGYTFVRWTRNGSQVSTSPTYSFTVTGNASYVAVFDQNSYTVSASASPSAGGTVNGAGNYNHGSNCTLTATANTGYTFVRWTKNGSQVSTNPTYSFTVTGNASYVAVFSQNTYTVSASASPSAGGTVSGAGSYNHGSNCAMTAAANDGYAFVNWTENGETVSSSSNYSFTVTHSRTLVANFEMVDNDENHWIPQDANYEDNTHLTGVIQIDGVEQATTALEVGAFCNGECRGTVRPLFFPLTQRYIIQLTIFGVPGDEISFKLYDHDLDMELDLMSPVGFVFAPNGYGSLPNPYVLNFTSGMLFTRNLTAGWNWFSCNIEFDASKFELLKSEIENACSSAIIKTQEQYLNYKNGHWNGSLTEVNNEMLLMMYVDHDVNLTIEGVPSNPSSYPITINPGWNWISYLSQGSLNISDAFANFSPTHGDMVKDASSYSFYNANIGQWEGGIKKLNPGVGYIYMSRKSSTSTLVYPL